MAPTALLTIEQYLNTSYRPDVEFIDGELREKDIAGQEQSAMLQWMHGHLQAMISSWFDQHEEQWGILTGVETRTRVSATRVGLPDVVVVYAGEQQEILTTPPLIVIEVLSPGDNYTETQRRAQDYRQMGIQNIWLIDPQTRTSRVFGPDAWIETTRFEVAGTPIYLYVTTLFARLDKSLGHVQAGL